MHSILLVTSPFMCMTYWSSLKYLDVHVGLVTQLGVVVCKHLLLQLVVMLLVIVLMVSTNVEVEIACVSYQHSCKDHVEEKLYEVSLKYWKKINAF